MNNKYTLTRTPFLPAYFPAITMTTFPVFMNFPIMTAQKKFIINQITITK